MVAEALAWAYNQTWLLEMLGTSRKLEIPEKTKN